MTEVWKAIGRTALRLAGAGTGLLLLLFAFPAIWRLFSPFIIALAVAATLEPVIAFAGKRLKMARRFAVVAAILLLCAVLLLLSYWFISFAVDQLITAVQNAPALIEGGIKVLQDLSARLLSAADHLPKSVSEWISTGLDNTFTWLYDQGMLLVKQILSGTVTVAAALPSALIYLNFLVLGVCFTTARYDKIKAWFALRAGRKEGVQQKALRGSAVEGALGYIRVAVIYTLMVLVVSWIYLQSFGFSYSALIASLAALLEFLPLFGNGTLYIPWAIVCLALGDTARGIEILALHLLLYFARKLTEPSLMSSAMGLSPLLSLISMYVGMKLWGVWGLTLAPIAAVVLLTAVRGGAFKGAARDIKTLVAAVRERLSL